MFKNVDTMVLNDNTKSAHSQRAHELPLKNQIRDEFTDNLEKYDSRLSGKYLK